MHNEGGRTLRLSRPAVGMAICAAVLGGDAGLARGSVYVVNWRSNALSVVDPIRRVETARIALPPESRDVAVSPDGSRVYVAAGSVTIIDAATSRAEPSVPPFFASALAVPSAGTPVWAAGSCIGECPTGSGTAMGALDPMTGEVQATFALPTQALAVVARADGQEAYVAACGDAGCTPEAGGRLHFADLSTRTIVTIPLSLPAYGLALSADGRRLFLPVFDFRRSGPQDLVIVDTETRTVADTVRLPGYGSIALAVSPNGRRIYLADRGTGSVHVFDPDAREVVATIDLKPAGAWPPVDPFDIALDPSGTRLWVIDANVDALLAVDVAARTVLGNVAVGPGVFAVAAARRVQDGGLSASDSGDRRCARRLATVTMRGAERLLRCHARTARRALRAGSGGRDETSCRDDAVAAVHRAIGSLPECEACIADLDSGLVQAIAAAFDRFAASTLYCDGEPPLYADSAGTDSGVVPPDTHTFSAERRAGRALARLGRSLLRCELQTSAQECRGRALARYDRVAKRLGAKVPCIADSAGAVRRVVQPALGTVADHLRCFESRPESGA